MLDVVGAAAAVRAAVDTGMIAGLIERRSATAAELAAAHGLHAGATEIVLGVLVALGAATRDGDRFLAAPALEGWLAMQTQGAAMLYGHLPEWLRTGEPAVAFDGDVGVRESTYRRVTPLLAMMFRTAADELAARLPFAPSRILDVGCGSGVWGLALGARHPEARVTGLDLPAVLEAFRAHAAERGLGGRIDTIAGDAHEVAIPPASFDLAVIANVLRIESEARASNLIARVAPAVAPGGAILVVDALGGGTFERELSRAVYAMHLSLRNRHGRVHTPATIAGWLAAHGFARSTSIEVPRAPGGLGALLATRPSTTDAWGRTSVL